MSMIRAFRRVTLWLIPVTAACSASSGSPASRALVDGGAPADAKVARQDSTASVPDATPKADVGPAVPDGGSDATRASEAGPDAGAVLVLTNLSLPNPEGGTYPQLFDVFLPPNPVRVVVFLHGGGGTKEGGEANEIVIRTNPPTDTPPVPDTPFFLATRTAFVCPQGQFVATASKKAATWSNYVMTSGVDDLAFLTSLASALRSGTAGDGIPSFSRVYLTGHSNGGMMTNRVWCEAPTAFDGYGALSGPLSIQLDPSSLAIDGGSDPLTGAHPCAPSRVHPYIGVFGDDDTVLQTKELLNDSVWAVNSCLQEGSGGAFVDPRLVSELRAFPFRTRALCGSDGGAGTTIDDGGATLLSACDGGARLETIHGADHCVLAGELPCIDDHLTPSECANSLEAESGTHMRDVLVDFFASLE